MEEIKNIDSVELTGPFDRDYIEKIKKNKRWCYKVWHNSIIENVFSTAPSENDAVFLEDFLVSERQEDVQAQEFFLYFYKEAFLKHKEEDKIIIKKILSKITMFSLALLFLGLIVFVVNKSLNTVAINTNSSNPNIAIDTSSEIKSGTDKIPSDAILEEIPLSEEIKEFFDNFQSTLSAVSLRDGNYGDNKEILNRMCINDAEINGLSLSDFIASNDFSIKDYRIEPSNLRKMKDNSLIFNINNQSNIKQVTVIKESNNFKIKSIK